MKKYIVKSVLTIFVLLGSVNAHSNPALEQQEQYSKQFEKMTYAIHKLDKNSGKKFYEEMISCGAYSQVSLAYLQQLGYTNDSIAKEVQDAFGIQTQISFASAILIQNILKKGEVGVDPQALLRADVQKKTEKLITDGNGGSKRIKKDFYQKLKSKHGRICKVIADDVSARAEYWQNSPKLKNPKKVTKSIPEKAVKVVVAKEKVRLTMTNGAKYYGEVKNGRIPHGQGTLTGDGITISGEFKDGKPDGQITLTMSSGMKYVGGWKNGKMDGQGNFLNSDGSTYVGGWKNGKFHGQGTATSPNGQKLSGYFENGKLIKEQSVANKTHPTTQKVLTNKQKNHQRAKENHQRAKENLSKEMAKGAADKAEKDNAGPSLFGTLVGIGLDIALDKDKGAPVDITSAMAQLRQHFFESTNYFLKSQEQLLRAYGKDTEAQMVVDAMMYAKNSKNSEADRMQNTMKVSTNASKIIESSLTSRGAALSAESQTYYSSSLSPAARGIASTIKILPAVRTIVRAIKQDAQGTLLSVGFEMIGILTSLPTYFSSMTGTMKLVLTGARSNNIQGAQELEANLGDLE